ncbi:MAG: DUF3489 domain-containing protein [Paracoccaceae bacterium]|uniref:DUF3489 domain-containing protein n=1 Tax=Hyphomonas sp. TaxID=87 RepID=UPI003274DF0D
MRWKFKATGLRATLEHCCPCPASRACAGSGRQTGGCINRRTPETKSSKTKPPSKLDALEKLLTRKNGASIAEMMAATGWQQHSVRGAMAGALKKRGLAITSQKVDEIRRYQAETSA